MGTSVSKLTVLFEDPFWVGLYERTDGVRYDVCKITFGGEPKDCEIYDYVLKNWSRLRFSPPIKAGAPDERRTNPKRLQRQIHHQLEDTGIGTKAQQALKLQRAEGKQARQTRTRAEREAEEQRLFDLRQEKRKEKHRGH